MQRPVCNSGVSGQNCPVFLQSSKTGECDLEKQKPVPLFILHLAQAGPNNWVMSGEKRLFLLLMLFKWGPEQRCMSVPANSPSPFTLKRKIYYKSASLRRKECVQRPTDGGQRAFTDTSGHEGGPKCLSYLFCQL